MFLLAASAAGEEREIRLASKPADLIGTLLRPVGGGKVPGVLILGGSGPTDRDGNQPGMYNDSLKLVAHGLAGCGIASLRPDKRGVAASHAAGAFEEDINFDDYVTDAVRWARLLAAQPGIGRIELMGHSEGALFATLAAQQVAPEKLVLLEGAGRPAGAVLREQLAGAALSPGLRRRAFEAVGKLERGESVEEVPPALGLLFRPSVQAYLIAWFAHDPVAELARTTVPALVVQGGTDLQIPPADGRRLAAARSNIELAAFGGMNHVLRAAPEDWSENLATYRQRDLPLMPGVVERLCRFLK